MNAKQIFKTVVMIFLLPFGFVVWLLMLPYHWFETEEEYKERGE